MCMVEVWHSCTCRRCGTLVHVRGVTLMYVHVGGVALMHVRGVTLMYMSEVWHSCTCMLEVWHSCTCMLEVWY